MAGIRCKECGEPKGRKRRYSGKYAEPIGYPDTAAICGKKDCRNPGLVWLEKKEWAKYQRGKRIFCIPNNAVKIKVK